MKRYYFISLFFLSLLSYPKAWAVFEVRFPDLPSKDNVFSMSLQKEFFHTVSNYKNYGQYFDLPQKNYFQYAALHPSVRYSPLPSYIDFELFSHNFYARSKTLNVHRDVFRSALFGTGLRLHYNGKKFYLGLEVRGAYPLVGNFQSDQEMVVGDSAYFVEPSLWAVLHPSPSWNIYWNASFRHRFFSLSSVFFNRLGGMIQTKYTNMGLSIDSFFSVFADPLSRQAEKRFAILKKVNGSSYRFYSVNPSILFSMTAFIDLKLPPAMITFYFNGNTLGSNYSRGFTLGMRTKLQWKKSADPLRNKANFDWNEKNLEGFKFSSERPKYFEEKEDPYNKELIHQELKKELKVLSD